MYHAFPDRLRGGFVGVDVFFVISGYLISTLLFEALEQGSFSLGHFYGSRIRRIVPALLVVLLASYGVGWFNLLADEYMQLGKHVAAGATFVSNLVLWNEAGYFDQASEAKPLLHLWSLGVEEQFYLGWPLLLWLAWRRKLVAAATIVLAAASLVAYATWGQANPVAGFYLPLTRLWELLAGTLLAWMVFRGKVRGTSRLAAGAPDRNDLPFHALSLLGASLLAYAVLSTRGGSSFSVAAALIPVVGAVCIIAAGMRAWPNRLVLSSPVAVWIGLISFPLYLWHWPLLSFARILAGQTPGTGIRVAAIAVTVVLAWATYRLLEVPVRYGSNRHAKTVACGVLLVLVFGLGRYTYDMDGLPGREVVALNTALLDGNDGWDGRNSMEGCGIADPAQASLFAHCAHDRRGNIKYALLGDSKAGALYAGLVRTSTPNARWMLIGGSGAHGAPIPLVSNDPALGKFQPLIRTAIQAIGENDDVRKVVIAAAIRSLFGIGHGGAGANARGYDHRYLQQLRDTRNYDRTLEGLSESISRLSARGKGVVLVVDNPPLPEPRDCAGRRSAWRGVEHLLARNPECVLPLEVFEAQIAIYRKLLAELKARHPGAVEIFDPTAIYCDRARSVCDWSRNGRPLYDVTDHISDYAGGLVGRSLNSFLDDGSGARQPTRHGIAPGRPVRSELGLLRTVR